MAVVWQPPIDRRIAARRMDREPQAGPAPDAQAPARSAHTTAQDLHHQQPAWLPTLPELLENLVIREPDEVWVADLTYIRLGQGFVFLAVIMDVFTRTIRGWHLSRDANTELTLIALQRALQDHVPQIHHSDQGVQYAADVYTKLLDSHEVQISMAAVGAPEENGYAERLIRTLKEEEVDLSDYRDFADAYQQIGHFIQEVYNRKRIHSSLGYLTPLEFETAFSSGSAHATAAPAGAD